MAAPSPAARRRRPLRVALTGGIAAGKSEALRAFRRAGAAVCSSDEIVHRLIASDEEVRAALERRFGTTDRARIAAVVFEDAAELAWLEHLLHPRVRRELERWLERLGGTAEVAVVEIPLLYETGADALFDAVVVVTAPLELRRARGGDKVDARSARLVSEEEKVRRADFSFVNDGPLSALESFVRAVLAELRR